MSATLEAPTSARWHRCATPTFRMLWLAWLAANISLWMHDVAAAWLMTTLTSDPALVALVQTASTLPMFLLGLPSGALADIVDRRRYFAGTQLWAATIALLLMALALAGALSAPLLLLLTFLNGITHGDALAGVRRHRAERWCRARSCRRRSALNGAAMNVSRIVGPAIAGAMLASAGSALVFALNAWCRWPRSSRSCAGESTRKESALPGERFVGAMRVGLQYVRQAPRLQVTLVRIGLFMLQVSGLMSLLPLLAKQLPEGGAGAFSALLGATGLGAVAMVVFMGRVRERFGRDRSVTRRRAAARAGRHRRGARAQPVADAAVHVRGRRRGDPDRQLDHRGRAADVARLGARTRHGAVPDGADGRRRRRRRAVGPRGRRSAGARHGAGLGGAGRAHGAGDAPHVARTRQPR